MDDNFRYVTVRDLRFRVLDHGSGKPLLLLHGFPDCLTVWRKMIPGLMAAGYRVIAFDQRGCGETDVPAGKNSYRITEIVDDIPGLLDALGITEPVAVIGHDWGAAIAWAFALTYPQRVSTIVAVSVGHLQSYGRAGIEQKLFKGLYVLWFQFTGVAEWYLLKAGGLGRWLRRHEDIADIVTGMARPGRLTAGLNWYRANLWSVLFHRWPVCRVPALGVWSTGDDYLTEAQMRDSANHMDADWTYQRIEHCGHWIPLEAPEKLTQLALDWFEKQQPAYPPELSKHTLD
jgi:pimeloyl-ACP methyl ester carboxylesterase